MSFLRGAMRYLLAVLSVFVAGPLGAGEWGVSGYVGLESRYFPNSPQFAGQFSGAQNAFLLQPEFRYRSENRRNILRFVPNVRVDSRDSQRNLVDATEFSWLWLGDRFEVLAGISKVFWGVAESRHLVDIINQDDQAEDIDLEAKLGQPMLRVTADRDWGRLSAFILPFFRERTFPGVSGRLRGPLSVDDDNAQYESGAGTNHVDFSLRYSHFIGDWDFGVYFFTGTDREPVLFPNATGTRFVPFYKQINQVGAEVQYTREAWLWKFEGIVREGQEDTFGATVAGFEYTFYQVGESPLDVGALLEYNYDGRDDLAPRVLLDNDVFAGTRLSFNDTQDSAILAGAIVDLNDQSTALSLEAETRLGDRWKLEVESRWFVNVADRNTLAALRDDSYVTLRIRRYF